MHPGNTGYAGHTGTEARKKIKIEGYKALERRRSDADEDKKGGGICITLIHRVVKNGI